MLEIKELSYRFDDRVIFRMAAARIPAGHKVGLVGPNGSGKSTLLNLIVGRYLPDHGDIFVHKRARVASVAQEAPGGNTSLVDFVLAADKERTRLLRRAAAAETGEATPEAIADIHQRLADIRAETAPSRAARVLAGLGFDHAAQQQSLDEFSGGWRMRVALAATLFLEPDLLLLDEPTNYLDFEATHWLEQHLRTYPGTVLVVSHDRSMLNEVANHILHLHGEQLKLYRGNYDQFDRQRREDLERQEKMLVRQQAERKHMQAFVDRFRYKASKARQAQSRLKMLEKLQPIAAIDKTYTTTFRFDCKQQLAPPILEVEKGSVGYEADKPILRRLNLRIDQDDRIALLGQNGNGKTTLAKLLVNELDLFTGTIHRHPRLSIGYFAQHQLDALNADETAYAHMQALLPETPVSKVRARLGSFGLAQEKADLPVADISGGEKARLMLAMITVHAPEMLVLDEPTNHLDIDARDALVHALNSYEGAIIVISHDRHFVNAVADRLWLVADGTVQAYDGDLDAYRTSLLAPKKKAAATESEKKPDENLNRHRQGRQSNAERRKRLVPFRNKVKTAEAKMAELNRAIAVLDEKLQDPTLYTQPGEQVSQVNQRRGQLIVALEQAEQAWLMASEALDRAEKNNNLEA